MPKPRHRISDVLEDLAALESAPTAEQLVQGAPRLRARTRLVREVYRAQAVQDHDDRIERSYAIVALAIAACEAWARGAPGAPPRTWSRKGIRAAHVARALDAWGCWGPWLMPRTARSVAELLEANAGRPSACGLTVVRVPAPDEHVRWSVSGSVRDPSRESSGATPPLQFALQFSRA